MSAGVRETVVAGAFYAGSPVKLKEQIEWCYRHKVGPGALPRVNRKGHRGIIALVVPHAGYVYSGPVAAHAYKELAGDGVCDTALIVGPNHSGYGAAVSVWTRGFWRTPLGEVSINEEIADSLLGGRIKADETAHLYEHSIEVQLPWLQHLYSQVKLVPVAMLAQDLKTAREAGKAISRVGGNVIIIASTDFTHYEPHSVAARKDSSVIEAITALDEEELYQRCASLNCTMCGYGAVATAIVAAREKGAKKATLLKYASSGDTSGDLTQVVGYASIAIRR